MKTEKQIAKQLESLRVNLRIDNALLDGLKERANKRLRCVGEMELFGKKHKISVYIDLNHDAKSAKERGIELDECDYYEPMFLCGTPMIMAKMAEMSLWDIIKMPFSPLKKH